MATNFDTSGAAPQNELTAHDLRNLDGHSATAPALDVAAAR